MSALRRGALLTVILIATVLGVTATAAQAAFDDSATTTIGAATGTVAPVTALSTSGTRCTTKHNFTWSDWTDWTDWSRTRTLHAEISWTPSATTRGVTGYQVTAVFRDGSTHPIATVGPGTTSLAQDVDGSYADQGIRVRVTTLTGYGWTSAPTLTGAITC